MRLMRARLTCSIVERVCARPPARARALMCTRRGLAAAASTAQPIGIARDSVSVGRREERAACSAQLSRAQRTHSPCVSRAAQVVEMRIHQREPAADESDTQPIIGTVGAPAGTGALEYVRAVLGMSPPYPSPTVARSGMHRCRACHHAPCPCAHATPSCMTQALGLRSLCRPQQPARERVGVQRSKQPAIGKMSASARARDRCGLSAETLSDSPSQMSLLQLFTPNSE